MIAEIHGKLSSTGSKLHDRLEDQLTGDFFGTLRYLPFSIGFQPILLCADIMINDDGVFHSDILEIQDWEINVEFWPKDSNYGEIDLILTTTKLCVGLEVKYGSYLSSDDDIDNSDGIIKESNNQLTRYAKRIVKKAREKKLKPYLLLVAPSSSGLYIIRNVAQRQLIKQLPLGLLTWQECLNQANSMATQKLSRNEECVWNDIRKLLAKKGFDVFRGLVGIGDIPISSSHYTFIKTELNQWTSIPISKEAYYRYGQ